MTTKEQYARMYQELNERQWRLYLGMEAQKIGRGGIAEVARLSGSDRKTIRHGIANLTEPPLKNRIRKIGGGRKKLIDTDLTLIKDLEALIEPKGDPMSLTQWTTKSLVTLTAALTKKKHTIEKTALRRVLYSLGFSLKANKKNVEGVSHPDRDAQFTHITKTCNTFEAAGNPIVSVDCKKKELIGNFKNPESADEIGHLIE